ncbi:predicted protein [Arabidopsis lyrata subsp. lyrata]|uniref:Predicted protein n=1 Tax=Arabidopsis lyrata subsp. lyrata TaxID=81972 RepID=D7LN53_ARALL|nr:predicted protein [Arabidopsis lyrata subsp. lyrata]
MEKVVLRVHDHPLLPFDRFYYDRCDGCSLKGYFYGGYRCNELACYAVFHKECAESKPEISHHAHPKHLLKLGQRRGRCHLCERPVGVGYFCSICDFGMHLVCAKIPPLSLQPQLSTIENYKVHEHPLSPSQTAWLAEPGNCKGCNYIIGIGDKAPYYECHRCNLYIHSTCLELFFTTDAHHNSHLKHPLKYIKSGPPSYADHRCLLCGRQFQDQLEELQLHQKYELYHCEVCNFSIFMDVRCGSIFEPFVHESHPHPLYYKFYTFLADAKSKCDVYFSYHMPGPLSAEVNSYKMVPVVGSYKVVPNTSTYRSFCSRCHTRCKLPCILEASEDGVDVYFCSNDCYKNPWESSYY